MRVHISGTGRRQWDELVKQGVRPPLAVYAPNIDEALVHSREESTGSSAAPAREHLAASAGEE